ncbi:hypothetical protein GW950_00510 [Candidatus Wolfebacteria bacterium]|nr:hypothetical protein [Candidatus Wolfebacteria bacterium]
MDLSNKSLLMKSGISLLIVGLFLVTLGIVFAQENTTPPYCMTSWSTAWNRHQGGISVDQCYSYTNQLNGSAVSIPGYGKLQQYRVPNASPCYIAMEDRAPVVKSGERGTQYCPALNDVVKLSASQTGITEGGKFTINYEAPFALECTLSGKEPEGGDFSDSFDGTKRGEYIHGNKSYDFVQRGIYTFKFSCLGYLDNARIIDKGTVTRNLKIFVGDIPPPPQASLSIRPTTITKGESATITWESSNAVSTSINRGIGIVPSSGSKKVSPSFTTRYSITAVGEFAELGLARDSVTLKVLAPEIDNTIDNIEVPPDEEPEPVKVEEKMVTDLKINGSDGPLTMQFPKSFNLSWNLNKYCLAHGSWLGIKRSASSQRITEDKPGTYTYKMYCPGYGSDEVRVTLTGASGGNEVSLPIAEASISIDGKSFSKSIRVTRGEPVDLWLSAAYDVTGDKLASRDDVGRWTSAMSFGGRCEWNSDLSQGTPTFEAGTFDPQTVDECTINLGRATFYDEPGVYQYGVLRLVQNDGRVSNTSYVNVAVLEPPPPDTPPIIDLRINNIESNEVAIGAPSEYFVSWDVKNADSCEASDAWEGDKFLSGIEKFVASFKKELDYSLTCYGLLGTTTASVHLKVAELPVCDFSALPTVINSQSALNTQSVLSWKCQFANSCSISPGVEINGQTFGSTRVSPKTTTSYKLTCVNLEGESSFSEVIEVK